MSLQNPESQHKCAPTFPNQIADLKADCAHLNFTVADEKAFAIENVGKVMRRSWEPDGEISIDAHFGAGPFAASEHAILIGMHLPGFCEIDAIAPKWRCFSGLIRM